MLFAFGIGFFYDVVTFIYVAWPLVLFLWLTPTNDGSPGLRRWGIYALCLTLIFVAILIALRIAFIASFGQIWPLLILYLLLLPLGGIPFSSRVGQFLLLALFAISIFGLLFVGTSELIFWDEFQTRFNFIAVDYLVYTSEVIGNIRESYPIGRWIAELAVVSAIVVYVFHRFRGAAENQSRARERTMVAIVWFALTCLVTVAVSSGDKERSPNPALNALAGNGIYEFFAAFRANKLDYASFYRTLPRDRATAVVRGMLDTPDARFIHNEGTDFTREIRAPGPERRLNIVLISVESLSASYMAHFGNQQNLTPRLDALADQSALFTQLYANGTRTVRGLEALSLSTPPTPGDSIVRQAGNENLFSLGSVLNAHGYRSAFVYGGYGYFDNMSYFFSHNGYDVVDRGSYPKDATIHAENVWGIADEDLYTMTMRRMDANYAEGKPFFLHVMTTSNHRPYTFPTGRVNGGQGKRDAAVMYTDWAIGDFIDRVKDKPYFANTLFVITADHCASSAGKTAIPLDGYHIPLIIYAPALVKPVRIDKLMAQIDIPPTLLGMLHMSYRSRFFGYDILNVPADKERAFPATYQQLGYLHDNRLTILSPGKRLSQNAVGTSNDTADATARNDRSVEEAIASYQVAASMFESGNMRWRPDDATPIGPAPASSSP
ncbi:LTA synthase family protein [Luteibacter rhizovicinus]|nr:alkaline phosphatase family protein [Luteibacter rhizovicinus]